MSYSTLCCRGHFGVSSAYFSGNQDLVFDDSWHYLAAGGFDFHLPFCGATDWVQKRLDVISMSLHEIGSHI